MSSTSKPQPTRAAPEQGLPQAIDTERLVLGAIQLNGSLFPSVAQQLQPDDFALEWDREIFGHMQALYARGEAIDRVTLAAQIGKRDPTYGTVGGVSHLASLDNGLPEIVNLDHYVRIVKRPSLLRKFIREFNSLIQRAMRQEDPDMLLPAAAEAIRKLQAESGQKPETPPSVPQWPEPLHQDAFHGVAGDLVRLIEPHTESDPAALLIQVLIGWGSLINRSGYYLAEADRHYTNEYAVIVGISSKARKGTAWGRIKAVLSAIDPDWAEDCQLPGVGSGEALVDSVNKDDKRALVIEGEFARLLAVVSREGSTASANLRTAWDIGTLAINTRQNKVKVTGAHVSMIGHVTRDELLRRLDSTETANGFGNRILWVCARRSKKLPHGGGAIDFDDVIQRLQQATQFARRMGNTRVKFDADAAHLWESVYEELSEGQPGILGSMTSRAEAHTVRLALIYALLDGAEQIRAVHLRAGLAVWVRSAASARFIWGDAIGDPTADEILRALRVAGENGLTRWDLTNHLGRNKPAPELDRAIGVLAELGLIRWEKEESGGRPSTRYWAA
jgi:hypothetical protein